jgi:hypothetical protein
MTVQVAAHLDQRIAEGFDSVHEAVVKDGSVLAGGGRWQSEECYYHQTMKCAVLEQWRSPFGETEN